jgi:hypothetical protein
MNSLDETGVRRAAARGKLSNEINACPADYR